MSAKHPVPALALALTLALIFLLSAPSAALAAGPKVEIFMTSWCPYCKKAKAYFDAKGIAYTASDIEKDPAARMRYQKYGQRGVPLVIIGDKVIPGYSVADYEEALAAAKPATANHSPAQPKMVFGK